MPEKHNQPLLTLRDLHVAYIKKEILRGVSLTLNRGELVALMGGNGSGKSTLLKTIAGLLRPTSGSILLNDGEIVQESMRSRHSMGIGYLLQGGRVFANLSVAENFGIAARLVRTHHNDSKPLLGYVFPELAKLSGIRAGLLSGGQRQMLSIELVLAQNPQLLLLDEPTGALAPNLARTILGTVATLCHERDCGVLLVEQNVDEAERHASRAYLLANGVASETLSASGGCAVSRNRSEQQMVNGAL